MASLDFELVIRGATVLTGDGWLPRADVAVADGRIAAIAPSLPTHHTREVVVADGLLLTPGFIDLHAHSALEPFQRPSLIPKVAQGFTTELINPDGLAPAPVAPERREDRRAYLRAVEGPGPDQWTWSTYGEYLDALDAARPATSLVPAAGHNAIRDHVLHGEARRPAAEELRAMRDEVRRELEAGARALSLGLVYLPGVFADTEELVALAREAARVGAPLVVHVRNEGAGVLEAVGEMVEVARRSGAPLHLSHLKVVGDPSLVEPLLTLVDRAARDLDVTFDQYPYGAGTSPLTSVLPPWALAGGPVAILARLSDAASRRRIATDVAGGLPGWENLFATLGPDAFVLAGVGPPRQADDGKTLAVLGKERGSDPLEAALDLLLETRLAATTIEHYASEETVRTIFRHPLALVGTDAVFSTRPHPRVYGTAPRVLGRYAIREHLVPLEEAVSRLTARAADRLGLSDRGRVREGLRADLVLLEPASLLDTATYEEPERLPEGVVRVLVAGRTVWSKDPTEDRPGGVVHRPAAPGGSQPPA